MRGEAHSGCSLAPLVTYCGSCSSARVSRIASSGCGRYPPSDSAFAAASRSSRMRTWVATTAASAAAATSGCSCRKRSVTTVTQQAWSFHTSPVNRRILPMPCTSATAQNGSATMYPDTDPDFSAVGMSAGGSTTSCTVPGPGGVLITGSSPACRSSCCNTMLWMEYQPGTANVVPARSVTSSICGATASAAPLVWFQPSTFTGTPAP